LEGYIVKSAKVLYALGSSVLIFMGIAHFYGQFGPKEFNIQRSLIEEAMRQYTMHGLGFEYTLMDVMQCRGIFFGVLMIMVGSQNLWVLRESISAGSMMKSSVLNGVSSAVLFLIGALYVPFTAVGMALAPLCFLTSAYLFYKNK
jgi:hypothetical protein